MTALEARLQRRGPGGLPRRGADRAAERIALGLTELAARRQTTPPPSLVPVPLPDVVDTDELFALHRGDGVPLGLVEQPVVGTPGPYWWQPGADGTRLIFGSPRSGVRDLLDTLIRGVVERFAADDVHLYVIDHHPARLAAIRAVAHTGAALSPEHRHDVDGMLTILVDELARRRDIASPPAEGHPTLLLIVRHLGRLSRDDVERVATLAIDGTVVGINVVAAGSRRSEAGEAVAGVGHVLVGGLSDPGDYVQFGVDEPADLDRHSGRCSLMPTQRLVQLGSTARTLESVLDAIHTEPARERPPQGLRPDPSAPVDGAEGTPA